MRILVIPERLEDLSQQTRVLARELDMLAEALSRTLGGLDWEIRQQTQIDDQVRRAISLAKTCAQHATELARFLQEKAHAFREADSQGAQSFGAITTQFLSALRSLAPVTSLIASYILAGRTATQRFLDLLGIRRYGPLAPWLKIGVLDQRYGTVKKLIPVGIGVGIAADVLTADRISEETLSVAIIRNVGEYAAGTAVPWAGIALAGNALIQLGGAGITFLSHAAAPVLSTSQAMAEDLNASTDQLQAALQRVDLGRITRDISEIVYDLTLKPRFDTIRTAWQQPTLKNLAALSIALNPLTPLPSDPNAWNEVVQDSKKLLSDAFDFTQGMLDLGFSFTSHVTAFGTAAISKMTTSLPLPTDWKKKINSTCEWIIDRLVSQPSVVKDSQYLASGEAVPPMPSGPALSWANSIQFTPVTG